MIATIFCIINNKKKTAVILTLINTLYLTAIHLEDVVTHSYRKNHYDSSLQAISTELKEGNVDLVIQAIDATYNKNNKDNIFKGAQVREYIRKNKAPSKIAQPAPISPNP